MNFKTSVIIPVGFAVCTSGVMFHVLKSPTAYSRLKAHVAVGAAVKVGLLFHVIPCSVHVLSGQ